MKVLALEAIGLYQKMQVVILTLTTEVVSDQSSHSQEVHAKHSIEIEDDTLAS